MAEDFVHNGYEPEGADVDDAGVLVLPVQKGRKLVCLTNASEVPIFLALKNSPDGLTNQAVVNKGIFLAPYGGAYEINHTNLYKGEVWAIAETAGPHKLCVQRGS